MKNLDIEIYLSNLIKFFETNPNDLINLVGNVQKEDFYKKLRERCEKNLQEGTDHVLTKKQIIDIVVELKLPDLFSSSKQVVEGFIEKTKWGDIILN